MISEVSTGMTLNDELSTLLLANGANMVGFADLHDIPPDIREGFPLGVSIAVALNPEIVSRIEKGPTRQYHAEYQRVNQLLDSLGHNTAQFLEERGYRAQWSAATNANIDADTLATRFPHKTVATRAGLGWIGKCALLVTWPYGSAVRITSVLTDASLSIDDAVNTFNCGDCHACVDVCPGQAPSGIEWQINLHRDGFFDAFACRNAARELAIRKIKRRETICGMCIAVCPWTQKYIVKSQ